MTHIKLDHKVTSVKFVEAKWWLDVVVVPFEFYEVALQSN